MAAFRQGKVVAVAESASGMTTCRIATDAGDIHAAAWPAMTGSIEVGDRVVVNTTGIQLGLGTGGWGFVVWNLDSDGPRDPGPGHVMKLRYTPWQTEVLAAESPESPHHDVLANAVSIDGMPVVACGLHSQIAGVAAGIKAARPDARVAYVMTDGGALPLAWSRLVRHLREAGLLDLTCTCGHAFGGELEAVNIFSALAAVRHAGGADIAIAAMGPGAVGTATSLGHTAMEQGQILDAASALGGRAIACLRICWGDERSRHRGLSHHTITSLTIAAQRPALLAVPDLPSEQIAEVDARLAESGLDRRHEIVRAAGTAGFDLLRSSDIPVASMGRSMDEIPELFLAAAAAGEVAANLL